MCGLFGDDNLIWILVIFLLLCCDKKEHHRHGKCRPCADDIIDNNMC